MCCCCGVLLPTRQHQSNYWLVKLISFLKNLNLLHVKLATGGSRWGEGNPAMAPIRSAHPVWQWDLAPSHQKIFTTEMAHILVILVSVYSVFFQPHSTSEPITINNIHIIDLVYTSPPLTLPLHLLCLWPIARHLITYSISTKLSEWKKAAKGRTLDTPRECKPPPSPHFLHCWLFWG